MTAFSKLCDTLKRMDAFIRRRGTGKPEDFARRLDISRATLFRYLNALKDRGAPIEWDEERCSYFYKDDFNLKL